MVSFENKGRFNNAISTLIYGMPEKQGVPTHFVRLWDLKTGEKMDKNRCRRDLGNVMEAYEEVLGRVKENLS